MKYLKSFTNHDAYLDYISGSVFSNLKSDSVNYCKLQQEVHFDKYIPETKLVCKYNVISITSPTILRSSYTPDIFKSMEIDEIQLNTLVTQYMFDTRGEHIVKYELLDNTIIGNGGPVFYTDKIIEAIIPDSVTSIDANAFYGCNNLTTVTIPNSVTNIGSYMFYDCSNLTNVNIPNGITTINDYTFYSCSNLTSITIPNNVTEIKQYAFMNSGITNINIPDSVTSIGYSAFSWCNNLISIIIGNGITNIGDFSFNHLNSITSITIKATTPPILASSEAFNDTNDCPIYVPAESVETYKAAIGWGEYADRIQAIPE